MGHLFPCIKEKPAFPITDAQIDKRNLFLISGRTVPRCRHKSFQEKEVPTDRESNFQILILSKNKLQKAELYR